MFHKEATDYIKVTNLNRVSKTLLDYLKYLRKYGGLPGDGTITFSRNEFSA